MTVLIWIGVAMTALGLVGLGWCIKKARDVKRNPLPGDQAQALFRVLIAVNMASVGFAFFGLGLMIAGMLL